MASLPRALRRRDRRAFLDDCSGMAALEFALLLPLMLILYLGAADVMRMVRASDKVEAASKTLADLTAQEPAESNVPIGNIATLVQAAGVAALPFNDAGLTLTVSAIDLKIVNGKCCTATVRWSLTQGGQARPCQTTLRQIGPSDPWGPDTIPAKIGTQTVVVGGPAKTNIYEDTVIATDIGYAFTGLSPAISSLISRPIMRHSYAVPRNAGQITIDQNAQAPAGMTLNSCPAPT